ncbi:hypothetical protein R1sor_019088 [Riccia sorocarpa]|uniref:Uncharacterized protein n=1 Tax=Riccia sorocarpa TaxID=122646 RepID=A0ABD3IFN1_9MARC
MPKEVHGRGHSQELQSMVMDCCKHCCGTKWTVDDIKEVRKDIFGVNFDKKLDILYQKIIQAVDDQMGGCCSQGADLLAKELSSSYMVYPGRLTTSITRALTVVQSKDFMVTKEERHRQCFLQIANLLRQKDILEELQICMERAGQTPPSKAKFYEECKTVNYVKVLAGVGTPVLLKLAGILNRGDGPPVFAHVCIGGLWKQDPNFTVSSIAQYLRDCDDFNGDMKGDLDFRREVDHPLLKAFMRQDIFEKTILTPKHQTTAQFFNLDDEVANSHDRPFKKLQSTFYIQLDNFGKNNKTLLHPNQEPLSAPMNKIMIKRRRLCPT